MNQLLRTYDWLKTPGLIALGAILVAVITNNLIAARLAPYTVPKVPAFALDQADNQQASPDPGQTHNLDQWANLLTERCPFGCAEQDQQTGPCGGRCAPNEVCQEGECVAEETDQSKQQGGPGYPTESDIKVKLLGSMVADQPEYSYALIKLENSQETYVVGPGDILPGNAVITRIRRDRIFVRREDGDIEYIRLDKTIGGSPSSSGLGRSTTSSTSGSRVNPLPTRKKDFAAAYEGADNPGENDSNSEGASGVEQVGDNAYQVSSEYLNKQLNNPAQLVREVRIQQNYDDGQRSGIRLSGMRQDGFYSSLGFQSGDVIKSVDGQQINKRSEAAQIWQRFKQGGTVRVEVERNGKTVERSYQIED